MTHLKWWQGVKTLTGCAKSNNNPLEGLANSICDGDCKTLANKINVFFQSVSSDLPQLDKSILPPLNVSTPVPDQYIISVGTVEKQLMNINIRKAIGPDGIPSWILHDFPGFLAPPVAAIFNSSIREGCLPSLWKTAIACPVPKVNPPKTLEKDLRPISLTCVLSKELESHPVNWLWRIVLPQMDPYQFGAMANVSTVHALIKMCHDWFESTDKASDKNYIHAVLVDYSKAFDRIHPNILMEKIMKLENIPPFLLHWIADFLSNRSQQVKIGNIFSEKIDIWGTVPQGTKLGVLLFLLMIDDLKTSVPTFKYVDDTTINQISNDPNDQELQVAMNHLYDWSCDNCMKLNTTKTKEMLISFSKDPPIVPNICVNGEPLERVNCVKLLGVYIASDLSWNNHIEYVIKKANCRMFCLNLLRRAKVSSKDILLIFKSRIRPILEYAAPLWHGGLTQELCDNIEELQIRACKIALPEMSYQDALDFMSLKTLSERRKDMCYNLFVKMEYPQDKLHCILPEKNLPSIITRNQKDYPLPKCSTNRYKNSFLPYVLFNCQ